MGDGCCVDWENRPWVVLATDNRPQRWGMVAAAPRVVIVDDHRLFRSGVRVELGDRVDVVAEADDMASAVSVIEQWRPDVVCW